MDELEMAAATPVSLARTLSEQRVDAKAMAALLRDADQRAAAGAPVPMLPRRAATVSRETTIRPPALAPRRMRSDVAMWRVHRSCPAATRMMTPSMRTRSSMSGSCRDATRRLRTAEPMSVGRR